MDADWDSLADTDPDETRRMALLLEGRAQGFGIPDDIMMRLNISTALDVREVLDATLPNSVTEPGTVLGYDRRAAPEHIIDTIDLLQDQGRELTVGGSSVTAGSILGDTWDEYTDDVMAKIGGHLKYRDLLGARRAVWHIALSGVSYASEWYPNPWWPRAVDVLRRTIAAGRLVDVFALADRATEVPPPVDTFWATLLTRPAGLNGPQCNWVQRTKLGTYIRDVREIDRDHLQPSGERTFGPLSALF